MSADLPIQMFDKPKVKRLKKRRGHMPVVARMQKDLIEMINVAAKANFRSRSDEIRHRLQASFENESIDEHGCIVVHAPACLK